MELNAAVRQDLLDTIGTLLARDAGHYLSPKCHIHLRSRPNTRLYLIFISHSSRVSIIRTGVFFMFDLSQRRVTFYLGGLGAKFTARGCGRLPDRIENRELYPFFFLLGAHAPIIANARIAAICSNDRSGPGKRLTLERKKSSIKIVGAAFWGSWALWR